MATKADNETKTILRKLGLFTLLFYIIYYLASVIMVGAFQAGWEELGRYPFRIRDDEFMPQGQGRPALGAWLAMVVTFVACLGSAFFVIRATRKTWDYASTTSLVHLIICIIVNRAFPVNWVWWVTLIVCNLLLSAAAEVAIYYLRDLREIELNN